MKIKIAAQEPLKQEGLCRALLSDHPKGLFKLREKPNGDLQKLASDLGIPGD
jgi:hypothetical protein